MPKEIPRSGLVLRRRVLEEMRRPGKHGRPCFESDAELARIAGINQSHLSKFLHGEGANWRGLSMSAIERLAKAFNLQVWQLFFVSTEPYEWHASSRRP
jgi:transcriptional regulator with XRE-family HTH domain